MFRFVLKRILLLIPVIIAVSFIVYALLELAPGTIIDTMITETTTQEDIVRLREQFNLDKPMLYRYGLYMLNLIRGDLGVSQANGLSVWNMYIERLPNTLILSFSALAIGACLSVPLGIFAARHSGKLADNVTTTFTLIGMSMPVFWLGVMLLLIFSLWLGWLPAGDFREGFRSLILPAICSALILTATTTRQTRSSMLEVLNADYLRTARAKGVSEAAVIRKHALGNAWIPILTALGSSLSVQLAGAVVVESVFTWPGVGRMAAQAVFSRDVTSILGCVIMTTMLYVLVQLLVDILYSFVDPRIRSQYVSSKKKKAEAVVSTAAQHASPLADPGPIPLGPGDSSPWISVAGVDEGPSSTDGDTPHFIEEDRDAGQSETISKSGHRRAALSDSEVEDIIKQYRKRSRAGELVHRIRKNKGAVTGFGILGVLLIIFLYSLFIPFEAVTASNIPARLTAPSWQYPFGTDNLGRDAFIRVLYGTRYSLGIGIGAVALAAVLGVSIGSIAGYYGGAVEEVIMRISDTLASIPGILMGMVIVTVLGQELKYLIIAVGVASIPAYIRITRASILTVRNNEYVESARAVGLSDIRIIFSQVLPNGLSPIIVTTTANLGITILVAASLSFLGFGIAAPHPEWGVMISNGRDFARAAPWLMAFPGFMMMLSVLAFNLLGDGLRDALDPKLKK